MTALVLCEVSGVWSAALHAAGFDVLQVDLQCVPGRVASGWFRLGVEAELFAPGEHDVVCAFPPCTDLSSAGARLWPVKDCYGALSLLSHCSSVAAGARFAGLVENPRGLARRVLGQPSWEGHPFEFGDRFMKRTCLWSYGWPLPFSSFAGDVCGASFVEAVLPGKSQKDIRSRAWEGMASAFVASLVSKIRRAA